jgi:hypothetical protein
VQNVAAHPNLYFLLPVVMRRAMVVPAR